MAVGETIVREYFELHGFFVRQQRKSVNPNRRDEEDIDFFVINSNSFATVSASTNPADKSPPIPFVLRSSDLQNIARAVIVVRAWHTEVFNVSTIMHISEQIRFADPSFFSPIARTFGSTGPLHKILALSDLPQNEETRAQSIALLQGKGIDAVITFTTMLLSLIAAVEENRNYTKSDLLQTLRILKAYDLLKDTQMELFKIKRIRKTKTPESDK